MRSPAPSLFSSAPLRRSDLSGAKVTVMGLGLFGGGRGLAEFLVRSGADVLVTDLKDEKALAPSIEPLRGLPIRWVLGRHRDEDFLGADRVFVNPAVPRELPLLWSCRAKGIPLDTEMNLFLKLARGRLCGVTGSNGKTTTTSLIGAMVRKAFPRTWLGGNLGRSLLDQVDEIGERDWVILELSSFQLEDMAPLARRPEISLITGLSPNHLNRHGTYENYLAAKRVILDGSGDAVINGDDCRARSWGASIGRRVTYFGRAGSILPRAAGVWVSGDAVEHSAGGRRRALFERRDLRLAGRFNLINAAGAAAASLLAGCGAGAIVEAAREFAPIEHRLEVVREVAGVRFYNDSKATTPESTLCALEALGPDVILIAGGSDKGTGFKKLGHGLARRTRGVVLIGQTAPRIRDAIREAHGSVPTVEARSLAEAVQAAYRLARSTGSHVALSPACASFDMFSHFEERGRRFKEIVAGLEAGEP